MNPWKSETVTKTFSLVGFLGKFDFSGMGGVFGAFDASLGEGGS